MVLSEYRKALGEREVVCMELEWKSVMKFMRGTKLYRKSFGWHPVYILLCSVVAMLMGGGYIVDAWLGEVSTNSEHFTLAVFPAVFFLIFSAYFGNQCNAMAMLGKSLLSVPLAKQVLTKGLVVSRLVSLAICMIPAVGMRLLCVALELCEVSMLDDMFLSFGVAFVLSMVISGYNGFSALFFFCFGLMAFGCAVAREEVFEGKLGFVADAVVGYVMPWWLVALVFVGLVVVGTWLGLVVLEHTYKKRKIVCVSPELQAVQR